MASNVFSSNLAAVPGHSQASTADPNGLLAPEEHYRVLEELLLRLGQETPLFDQLKSTRIHLGVKPGHYPPLL